MNKLANLIVSGEITVEDLADAKKLIERAELVRDGLNACKKTILFPLGKSKIDCYSYMDIAGEYEVWGSCTNDGKFTCSCSCGGIHVIGECNLMSFSEVFMAFENEEFGNDLRRFLNQQIKLAATQ